MAFADGELAEDQRAAVESYLASDAEARALVEALRRSRQLAADAFSQPMEVAQSRELIDQILATPLPGDAHVTQLRARRFLAAPTKSKPLMAMAASLALIAGSTLGYVLGRQSVQPRLPQYSIAVGPLPSTSVLAQLLETRASGSIVDLTPGGNRLTVAATFRDRHARPCREIEVLAADASNQAVAVAIACRSSGGAWSVQGAAQLLAWESISNQYTPSGASEKDALDGLISLLGAGRALDPTEERELIARGWKKME